MRLAVISDLHIGADEFDRNAPGFVEFLRFLEEDHDEIILLGDVYECYFPPLPWGALTAYDAAAHKYRDISDRFCSDRYTVLSGNHDIVAKRRRGIPSQTVRVANGMRVFLAHGHEVEPVYQHPLRTRTAELYMWFAYRIKTLGLPQLYDYGYRVDYETNMKDGGQAHLREASRILRQEGYDVVVFGHTHVERFVSFTGGGTYINTGDCLHRKMYASIDTSTRHCSLRHFRGPAVPAEEMLHPGPC